MDKETMDDLNRKPLTMWKEGLHLLIWGWGQDTVLDYDTIRKIAKAVEADLTHMMLQEDK